MPVSIDIHENEFLEEVWQEGRHEGEYQGARESLLQILELKFGSLPAEVGARVDAADLSTIRLWTRRAVLNSTLSEIIAP